MTLTSVWQASPPTWNVVQTTLPYRRSVKKLMSTNAFLLLLFTSAAGGSYHRQHRPFAHLLAEANGT